MGFLSDLFKKKDNLEAEATQEAERAERETMIQGIGELDEMTVREVMVPRIDVSFVDCNITLEDFYTIIANDGYSRYPVYENNNDNVIGVLYSKDLLRKGIEDNFNVKNIMREPFFVPDSKHLDDLLREFKLKKVHLAVAVDEYGGVSGIVCLEDILEVIVGEIQDEFDEEEDEIKKLDEKRYLVDARTNIEDLNNELNLKLEDDDFETVGGLVLEIFGRIPKKGESVEIDNNIFTVEEIDGHKIENITIDLSD
ncbi:MAG: hemolysin family protein [Sphaerochaetaceae bacterium]|nr:hemolysin family protein [Sphaerochaetaceae bacterium]MDC7237927.1 hemolysin family protein [Sphaerochaetaceae bacterium]MDC7244156.1 hemolysin family protein [Sphaerochaetaceae bacterium]MDC7249616.1 hemolysin family protein [Sphaerochaetaceae bacterium]